MTATVRDPGTDAGVNDVSQMSGARKVAVLLMSIGGERAARILRELDDSERDEVLAEIAGIGDLGHDVVNEVISDFAVAANDRRGVVEGGPGVARELLTVSFGAEEANAMMERLSVAPRFSFLLDLDTAALVDLLAVEHPQTVAVVLAYLPPDRAARLLNGFDEPLQRDVAVRIATMDRGNAASVDAIEENLARRAAEMQAVADGESVGGLKGLIALLTKSEKSVERAVVEALEALSPEMADEVRANLFVFEDVVTLDDRAVQQILRQVDTRGLAVALKGAPDEVAHKVKSNMSSRAAENLVEEIEMLPPTRAADIKEARAEIVKVIRMLEDQGDIQINRGVDDFV